MIDRLRLTQPDLDTKPGTVSRDLFVDVQADQLSQLYNVLMEVSERQALATTTGADLDRLAANFGLSRNTGTSANGIVVFGTSSIISDIQIPAGTILNSKSGATFETVGNFTISSSDKGQLASTANRIRKSLNLAGLNSAYAMEIPIQALRPGTFGNVAPFQINTSNLGEALSVVNIVATFGGGNREVDSSFRARILSIFSGSNIGTSAGYKNAILTAEGISDSIIIEPGDSLMLRDGTETIETNNGSHRIIDSGTGGKVDAYLLGRNIISNSESFIYADLSGTGNAADDRNNHILGQENQDIERTSEERRLIAFKSGILPMQPVFSMVSVTGSKSGLLYAESTDEFGNIGGNYKLEKDLNPETGGSPFGFDQLSFISNKKIVSGEVISKASSNGVELLRYSDIEDISSIYQDIIINNERAIVNNFNNNIIHLSHYPVVRVSKIINTTTGEVYIVNPNDSSNIGDLNLEGKISISGKRMPVSTDILSADYTWRKIFDEDLDYDKGLRGSDAVDWSKNSKIVGEPAKITRNDNNTETKISVTHDIDRVNSVFAITIESAEISMVNVSHSTSVIGIELSKNSDIISNIFSIKNSNGVEVYNTNSSDEHFSSRVIYLPSDSVGIIGDTVEVYFNRIELFDIPNGDGSNSGNSITLPSPDILQSADILDKVEDLFFFNSNVYASYVFSERNVISSTSLSQLTVSGSESSNQLFSSNLSNIDGYQPILFLTNDSGEPTGIAGGSPAQLAVEVDGITRPGKIKVLGEISTVIKGEVGASEGISGLKILLSSLISNNLEMSQLPDDLFVSKIYSAKLFDSNGSKKGDFDILGGSLKNNLYSKGIFSSSDILSNTEFLLPSTPNNSSLSIMPGDNIMIKFMTNREGFNDIYFPSSDVIYTKDLFSRIESISIPSGFRSSGGGLVGTISIKTLSEPSSGDIYLADYSFVAPKEGERITVEYNVNSSILEATRAIELVRPITADVLIKEAFKLEIEVEGQIIIGEDFASESTRIIEDATSAIVNILSSEKLGTMVDYSDIISVATSIEGVDSLNISRFSLSGETGRRAFIKALDNQYISPGIVQLDRVSREDFRIN
jgi:phage-related baseplate assembly protein